MNLPFNAADIVYTLTEWTKSGIIDTHLEHGNACFYNQLFQLENQQLMGL